MGKTLPLIGASLKGFMRNWRSVFLLVVFPMLLITAVFLSFNPDGMQVVPVGLVLSNAEDSMLFGNAFSSFLRPTKVHDLDACLHMLKGYQLYACIVVRDRGQYILDVYFDNTREPIIWEILERMKGVVDILKRQKSEEIASEFLGAFGATMDKVSLFKTNLAATNTKLDTYISEIDGSISKLTIAKGDLTSSIDTMDQDILAVKSAKSDLKEEKDGLYELSDDILDEIDDAADEMDNLTYADRAYLSTIEYSTSQLGDALYQYNRDADMLFRSIDDKIYGYESASKNGKRHTREIDASVEKLKDTKGELKSYQTKISQAEEEISRIESDFQKTRDMDPGTLASPIVFNQNPVYIPEMDEEFTLTNIEAIDDEVEVIREVTKGINLISLQVFFPTILFMLTLFLSLLISTFICLSDINSPANQRIRLMKGVFLPSAFSVYLSSLLIMTIPILCVLVLGEVLFRLHIFANIGYILGILFLVSSTFILLGMALSYLIKKESTTLLISTFLLVLLLFFSGLLLPVERMSDFSGELAANMPGVLTISAFNMIVFHGKPVWAAYDQIMQLGMWALSLLVVMLFIKKLRGQ